MTEREKWHIKKLFREQYTTMMQLTLRRLANKEQAEELVQSVFLLACIKSESFFEHPNPVGWLMKTMHFLILKANQNKYQPNMSLDECYFMASTELEIPLDSLLPNTLTDQERKVLLMRFNERSSYCDISVVTGLTEANCRKIASRALKKCRLAYQNG